MRQDKFGNPIFNTQDIFKFLYQGKLTNLKDLTVDYTEDVEQLEKTAGFTFQKFNEQLESIDLADFDAALQSDWFMPEEYRDFDIESWCLGRCTSPEQMTRVKEEMAAYRARNMLSLLQWTKHFVDTCHKNNIVWGVGRGSSVASFVLYLLGVHQIDSVKYNLDWQEFLR
jgi:DNA polymerase III alpha subunit